MSGETYFCLILSTSCRLLSLPVRIARFGQDLYLSCGRKLSGVLPCQLTDEDMKGVCVVHNGR